MLDTYIISLLDIYKDPIEIVEKGIRRNKIRHVIQTKSTASQIFICVGFITIMHSYTQVT